MNAKSAYSAGVDSGFETARYGDFSRDALLDYDLFLSEASEILENKRQFADSFTYEMANEPYSMPMTVGLRKGWVAIRQLRENAQAQQDLSNALFDATETNDFDGLVVSDLAEVPREFRGQILVINDHGNVTLYLKTARKLREIASRV